MMIRGVSINEMVNQSVTVLTKPSIASFEQFERHGGIREALVYVGVAAGVVGVVAFIFGLLGGFGFALLSLLRAVIVPVVAFLIFTYVLYWVARQQGGTGTVDEVFYTYALFVAPIAALNGVIFSIPLLICLAWPLLFVLTLYQVYLAYLAARSSMNIAERPAIISVVVAGLAYLVSWVIASQIFTPQV